MKLFELNCCRPVDSPAHCVHSIININLLDTYIILGVDCQQGNVCGNVGCSGDIPLGNGNCPHGKFVLHVRQSSNQGGTQGKKLEVVLLKEHFLTYF